MEKKKEEKERTLVRFAKHMTGTAGAAGEQRPAHWAAWQNLAENKRNAPVPETSSPKCPVFSLGGKQTTNWKISLQ